MNLKPFEIRMSLPQEGELNGPPGPPFPAPSNRATQSTDPPFREPVESVSAATLNSVRSEPTIRRWIEELEEAIVVLDAGIIIETNSRAPALFGRTIPAMLGRHIKELVTEESLMRLAHFLEFDDPEPTHVLGLRLDHRAFPLLLKAVASIIGDGRRLRVTSLTRCGAVERPASETPVPRRSV